MWSPYTKKYVVPDKYDVPLLFTHMSSTGQHIISYSYEGTQNAAPLLLKYSFQKDILFCTPSAILVI